MDDQLLLLALFAIGALAIAGAAIWLNRIGKRKAAAFAVVFLVLNVLFWGGQVWDKVWSAK